MTEHMGHDPLAWMVEEDSSTQEASTPTPVEETEIEEETEKTNQIYDIYLDSHVNLSNLSDVYAQLEAFPEQCHLRLHAEHVEQIDTASLQLLLCFIHSEVQKVEWISPSIILCDTAESLGLSELLQLSPH